ncbi:MAG TPA: SAM-dependent methyltransferase [Candidatus Sulfotelmatobacter sp.]|nr:SAM-dependent methyltransferase [Candidatus Sulfotelmatobacter sp.]
MKSGEASRTAEYNALFRALESARAPHRRLIEDRLARHFLRPPFRGLAGLLCAAGLGGAIARFIDYYQPGVRPSVVARTRLIDDHLRAALDQGIAQVVILGAGFDTRAYRLAGMERAAVFEVDHPNTGAVKQARIRAALGAPPAHVRYVAVDFSRDSLPEALARAGFDPARRCFFIWEGVSNYLSETAVDAMLRFLGRAPAGSRVVFTYVHRDILDRPQRFAGGARLHRRLKRLEERLTFGLDPADTPRYLAERGLRLIEDVGSVDYRARLLGARSRLLRGHEFYRVALAEVGAAEAANPRAA